MAKPLRYTGCWPPTEVLARYPNWVLAIDEEGEPDQDETTIKPEAQQAFISDETDYSAASAHLANGSTAIGILSLIHGKIDAIDVYDGSDWWRLKGEFNQKQWTPFVETWLPPEKRRPSVSLSDSDRFPMLIASRLATSDDKYLSLSIPLRAAIRTDAPKPWYKFW